MSQDIPWVGIYRSQLANGGERTCWPLGFPPRAVLDRVVVQQVSGVRGTFTLEIFNSAKACSGPSQSSGGDDPAGDYEADSFAYSVTDPQDSDTDGRLSIEWDAGQRYANQDGHGPSSREQLIYFQITPSGAGPMAFDVSISAGVPHG